MCSVRPSNDPLSLTHHANVYKVMGDQLDSTRSAKTNSHNNNAFLPWHRGFIFGQSKARLDSSSESIDGKSKI